MFQVEERNRNAVGAVDGALTSLFTFALYAACLHVNSVAAFGRVTWASAGAVSFAAVLFALYLSLWHEHSHTHPPGDCEANP